MMRAFNLFLLSFLIVMTISSCEKGIKGGGVNFKPNTYTVSGAGGEVITSKANQKFGINGSSEGMSSVDAPNPPFYSANENGTFLKADFFTAELLDEYRIKFIVEPNTTGKSRSRIIDVESAGDFGKVYLIQEAN